MASQISRRVLAAKQNGRLGGLKTASTHTAEFLEARASKAGCSTRDTYGNGYFSHIASNRKSSKQVNKEVIHSVTGNSNSVKEPSNTVELMQASVKNIPAVQM